MTFSSGITNSGKDICKLLLSAEDPFFDFLSESSYLKNRCCTFIFMGHDDIFTAGHPHQDAGEFTVINIQARHVDVGVPFAVSPGEVNVVGKILFAVLLADIFFTIETCCQCLPLILRIFASGRINAFGCIGVHGF